MRLLARSVAILLSFVLLSAPPLLQRSIGGDTRAYVVATIALALLDVWLVLSWRAGEPHERHAAPARGALAVFAAVAVIVLLIVICRAWLREILTIPLDPYRGDMLVVVREGLRRARLGLNPYTVYHVPWAAPLPYGPLLWGPFAIPLLLRIDLRLLTVAGELFVSVACGIAAIACARRGRLAEAAGSMLMLAAIGFDGNLRRFAPVGHTPAYWPLLALFAWLVVNRRWDAAAVSLGLLVAARSTMVAVAPVLLMTVWLRDRPAVARAAALTVLAAILPFLPFAVHNLPALTYAMYGSYEKVIKEVVWPDPTVPHTIGLTGVLLSHHWQRWVETVQVAVLASVYAACWQALRRERAPIGVMSIALLAFSMTTLWPVSYLYFDVFLLCAAGALAAAARAEPRSTASIVRGWTAVLAADVAIVGVVCWTMLPPGAAMGATTWREAARSASVVCVRRRASPAVVDVQLGPDAPRGIAVRLNGVPVGEISTSTPGDHWLLAPPAGLWQIGANALEFDGVSRTAIARVDVTPAR
jgi:hypothetical protein